LNKVLKNRKKKSGLSLANLLILFATPSTVLLEQLEVMVKSCTKILDVLKELRDDQTQFENVAKNFDIKLR
jgi:hypothetical protein